MRLHHVQLACPPGGEDDARRFWVDALGFEELPKPDHLAVRGGCWFRSGDCEIHVGVEPGFRAARKAHPALLVDDAAAVRQRLEELGYHTSEDAPLPGFDRFYVDDPFGNRLEVLAGA